MCKHPYVIIDKDGKFCTVISTGRFAWRPERKTALKFYDRASALSIAANVYGLYIDYMPHVKQLLPLSTKKKTAHK